MVDAPRPREHSVTISVNGREIGGWLEYQIDTSLIEPADSFQLSRPFSRDAWDLCRRDAYVHIMIDGQPRASGFVDIRRKSSAAGTMEITGRDRIGRMVQESAPRSAYGGTSMMAVLEALAVDKHLFQRVTLTNTKNRKVQLGKGNKAPADGEAIALLRGSQPKKQHDALTAMFAKTSPNRIDPGQSRFQVLTTIASRAGLAVWATADGKEIFVGKPNQTQPATFLFRHSLRGQSTVKDLEYEENNADRFSMITALGSGTETELGFPSASSHSGTVWDNPKNKVDGTGKDFLYPKRLVLPEQAMRNHAEAERLARLEQQRRDFARTTARVECWYHGQVVAGSTRTLFATDTMARVIDEEIDLDQDFLIYAASFRASRANGETTELQLVPRGTEVVV